MCLLCISCDYYMVNDYKDHVGVIENGANEDAFELCYKEKVFPYYYGRQASGFEFGKDSLRQYFRSRYYNQGVTNESGYITIRFNINCKGEAGDYEIHQLGLDFEKKKFNRQIVDQLYDLTRALKSWKPVEFYGDKYDSFIHISFKIENGVLKEILS